MKKVKLILVLLFIFIITGCTQEYNLEVKEGYLKEVVTGTLSKDVYQKQYTKEEDGGYIENLQEDKLLALYNSDDRYYSKSVSFKNNKVFLTYSYQFTPMNYEYSTFVNECIDNFVYLNKINMYYIGASGSYGCLYGKKAEINITTDKFVYEHNADKVKNNTYTWIINEKNVNDLDIEIIISKTDKAIEEKKIFGVFEYIVIALFTIGLIAIILYIRKKNKNIKLNSEEENQI